MFDVSMQDRFAGVQGGTRRNEHAVPVEVVERRAFARKDTAGEEAAEVAVDIGREAVGRLAPAGQPAAVVDIIGVEQILSRFEIIFIADRADRPFAVGRADAPVAVVGAADEQIRSEEHTSELQSPMRISSAVFCCQNKTNNLYNEET